MKNLKFVYILLILFVISCRNSSILESALKGVNKSIKEKYAPDKRVAIYDVVINSQKNKIVISGETNLKKAYNKLLDSLQSLDIGYVNKVRFLPDSAVGDKQFAIARNSVINIRSNPKHSAELGTQGLLGMPLKILDKKGDFYRVQTPDNYISWVDKGGITPINQQEFEAWKTAKKVIFTENFGYVYKDESFNEIISDISLGGLLKFMNENTNSYQVVYPDKRTGFIKKEQAFIYNEWLDNLKPSDLNIEIIAKKMDGFPYLWGGTSAKGMDCSGFTKMVYLMNGLIIPRDASQQVHAGEVVDKNLDFKNLEKGDLLFFGKKATEESKQKVTHVGIWLNNDKQEFIHASGNVHISSMDKTHPLYDEFNKNRYLGSRRYLGVTDKNIINLKELY